MYIYTSCGVCPVLFGSRAVFLPVLRPWAATRFRAAGLAVLLRRVLETFFGHVPRDVFFWPLRPERVLVASASCAQAAFSIALVCANFLGRVSRSRSERCSSHFSVRKVFQSLFGPGGAPVIFQVGCV